jgi:hypothetical protein
MMMDVETIGYMVHGTASDRLVAFISCVLRWEGALLFTLQNCVKFGAFAMTNSELTS